VEVEDFVTTLERVAKNIPIIMEARVKIFKHYRTLEIFWIVVGFISIIQGVDMFMCETHY
jgi:hypothetical protein